MNVLRIYFSAQWHDTPCPWALCDMSGSVLQQGVATLAEMPKADACIGIVSADRVLTFTTPKPPGNKRRWQSALPFIAEEHTLTDPDDIHAIAAPSSEPGSISVSIIAKSWLKQIVSVSTAAKLPLRRLVAESLLPDMQPDSWTLVWDSCNGFLRTSATTGLALDCSTRQTAPLTLIQSLSGATSNMPRQIEVRLAGAASDMPSWNLPVPLVAGERWDWQHAPISDQTPNLLSGDFTPPMRLWDGLSRLRPALYISLAAIAIEVVGTHIEWLMLAHEKNTLTHSVERIFHSAFGEESILVDAPLQMQRNLASLRHTRGVTDTTDFLPLLDSAAPALGTLNSGAIRSLSYEAGKLGLDIKLVNPAAFATLVQKLQRNGLHVRASDMHDLGDGTQAKLTISLEGLQ